MSAVNSTGAPDYLNGEFFDEVLENGLREASVTTTSISLSAGTADGENYCSQIYRAKVYFKRKKNSEIEQTSLMVKTIPMTDHLQFLEDMQVYHKEKVFYMDVLPKLEILLNKTKFAPRCFDARKKPVCTITFEDMNRAGFTTTDREIGLDQRHTKLALRKLGRFHAASMAYAKKEPDMLSRISGGMLDPRSMKPTSVLYQLFYKYLDYTIKLVSGWQGYEEITKKLQEFLNDFQNRLIACQAPRKGEIKVLNHGDFWSSNMMFKYENGKAIDVVFVDFQVTFLGSPGIDLNYFLYGSVQLDVLKNMDILLQTYYNSFRVTLEELQYENIPTYDDIVNEFRKSSPYGMFTLFGPMPVMKMDKTTSEGNSFANLAEGSDEKMVATFKKVSEHLRYSLKIVEQAGAFDN